jgi:hypothetical protein
VPAKREPRRPLPQRRPYLLLGGLAVVALLVVVLALALTASLRGTPSSGRTAGRAPTAASSRQPATGTTTAPSGPARAAPPTSAAPAAGRAPATSAPRAGGGTSGGGTSGARAAALPAGWTAFSNRPGAYTIGVPPAWRPSAPGQCNETDVFGPGGQEFIVQSTTPANDPQQAVASYERFQQANKRDYRRLAAGAGTYAGHPAATLEFTYSAGGTQRVRLAEFAAPNGYGYAVYFRAPADRWAATGGLQRQFESAFAAVAPTGGSQPCA